MLAILAMSSVCVFAQKGEKSAGLNLNFGTTAKNVGLGAKFQYGITDAIRIEPSLSYYFGGSGMLDITANAHYVFNIVPKCVGMKRWILVTRGMTSLWTTSKRSMRQMYVSNSTSARELNTTSRAALRWGWSCDTRSSLAVIHNS